MLEIFIIGWLMHIELCREVMAELLPAIAVWILIYLGVIALRVMLKVWKKTGL